MIETTLQGQRNYQKKCFRPWIVKRDTGCNFKSRAAIFFFCLWGNYYWLILFTTIWNKTFPYLLFKPNFDSWASNNKWHCPFKFRLIVWNKYTYSYLCSMSELIQNRQRSPWLWSDILYSLTPSGRQHKKYLKILHGFTDKVIVTLRALGNDEASEYRQNKFNGGISSKAHGFLVTWSRVTGILLQ